MMAPGIAAMSATAILIPKERFSTARSKSHRRPVHADSDDAHQCATPQQLVLEFKADDHAAQRDQQEIAQPDAHHRGKDNLAGKALVFAISSGVHQSTRFAMCPFARANASAAVEQAVRLVESLAIRRAPDPLRRFGGATRRAQACGRCCRRHRLQTVHRHILYLEFVDRFHAQVLEGHDFGALDRAADEIGGTARRPSDRRP